ncbi:MAG: D-methionine transport system permease protein [Pseudonocardiales bacterium]|nr:D-methionine transport system permease protein [Pseudonocardiales bacterium]MDT7667973.1 D-methionine transport system permease protein [Pseudonocardiales bacterium]MDT7691231.1 D-methionine transport system permease protein [Pseudonocardiales bacterium]
MSDWPRLAPELLLSFQQTIYLVAWTMVIAGVLGLTIGVLLHTTRRGGLLPNPAVFQLLNVLVNVVRPIPFIIFITAVGPVTLAVMGTTIGTRSVLFPMSAMASFVIGRVVEQNLVAVEPGVIEAARAMGASKPRIILTVLIPEALGALVLGYTFIFVAVVDMSAMAGYVGGGGLGNFAITYGYQQFNWPVTLVTVVIIIVIVQAAQFAGNWAARKALHR